MNKKQGHPKICLLHPGKTGGTYLKSIIRYNKTLWTRPIKLLSHRETMASTLKDFGADRQIAFSFRNPVDRFVSAFYSRLRQGRPKYNRMWSPAEAVSFLYFESANELAEALNSENERTKSAAYYAFNSIMHIKTNYRFHFESLARLKDEAPNIVACMDVANFDTGLPAFMDQIGISDFTMPDAIDRHANPEEANALSDAALANLKSFWALEFEFYDAFKEIENSVSG